MYKTLPQHTNNKLLDLTDISTNLFEDFKLAVVIDDVTVVAIIRRRRRVYKKNNSLFVINNCF